MNTTVIAQAISILSKIEASATHAQKLIETGNIDALPRLYAELHVCKGWVAELREIEDAIDEILGVPSRATQSQEGNRIAQFSVDRIIASSSALEQSTGLLKMIELVGNILHASRRGGRELSGFLSELQQAA